MGKTYQITLSDHDLGQLLDGLELRVEAWDKTAFYLRHDCLPDDELFLIEECSDPEEADQIAAHYRAVIQTIRKQMEEHP